eukprot:8092779-Pyramimonas_sp.AAC.1
MDTCVGNDIHPGSARRRRGPPPAEKERTQGPGVAASDEHDVDGINPSYDTHHGSHDCQHPMEVDDPAVSSSASPRRNQSKRGKGGASNAEVRIYGANCSTWGAASTLLDSACGGQVWALLVQEQQLSNQWIPEILASTKKRGITLAMT